jgi:hypothetical protein
MNRQVNGPPGGDRRWPQAVAVVVLAMLAWLTAWLVIRVV